MRQLPIWLAAACFVMGLGQLLFTTYVAPSDFLNTTGHVFKLLSYALIFIGFVIATRKPTSMRLICPPARCVSCPVRLA